MSKILLKHFKNASVNYNSCCWNNVQCILPEVPYVNKYNP